ncbi:bifunctional phosphatase PAP2/diacylglycerol kinase family protein [Streptomyces albus subsp. chlorinus]|uniref:bifunctional phosphatase PAP2/diacylglycerol kinase family protein n=1 Tax=Streptomyces albus TaxID=1888 RepID=UPI001FABF400|nr:bifunctional phosphatase PAP2/diacylglycerol kinase family protein [Streptomyces albus]
METHRRPWPARALAGPGLRPGTAPPRGVGLGVGSRAARRRAVAGGRASAGRGSTAAGAAVRARLSAWDRALFRRVAVTDWPRAEGVLPRLSRAADHSKLWTGTAAAIVLSGAGGPRARRGALRALASVAVTSAVVNTVGKGAFRRVRPVLDDVPVIRRLKRLPTSTSFPSGHSASAAAFATGLALESRGWGAAVAPVAASVAFSRVYTGVHYPSDVLVGAALGAATAFGVRAVLDARRRVPPAQPLVEAPALPQGRGLSVVANPGSGSAAFVEEVTEALPAARVTRWDPDASSLPQLLDKEAQRAAEEGGALGVFGGDGTVNAAARAAHRHGVPLAVLPGGTHNHLALDLGIGSSADLTNAVGQGHAIAVDLARFAPPRGAAVQGAGDGRGDGDGRGTRDLRSTREFRGGGEFGGGGDGAEHGDWDGEGDADADGPGYFVNTFSLGAYGDLVEVRDRWRGRVGPWAAGLIAAVHVLRQSRPFEVRVNGRKRSLWLLFVGNCSYHTIGGGPGGARRFNLADGMLDIHLVKAGRWARTRLVASAFAGVLHRSPVHAAARGRRLHLAGIPEGTLCSYDGETAPSPTALLLDKPGTPLTVYRPLPPWLSGKPLS